MVRAGRSMVRSMCVTSAIAAGPSAAKNGTLLTDSQVFRKLSRRVSAAKPVARIPVHSPNTPSPQIITNAGDQPAERRDRHHVAIAGGGQGRRPPTTTPPARCRRSAGCDVALQEIDRHRGQEQHHQEDHQHAEQAAGFQHQHPAQLPQPGNSRNHLEQPEHARAATPSWGRRRAPARSAPRARATASTRPRTESSSKPAACARRHGAAAPPIRR